MPQQNQGRSRPSVPSLFHIALGELARNRIRILQGQISLVMNCNCPREFIQGSNSEQTTYAKFVNACHHAIDELKQARLSAYSPSRGEPISPTHSHASLPQARPSDEEALLMPNLLTSPAMQEIIDPRAVATQGFRAKLLANQEARAKLHRTALRGDVEELPLIRKDIYYLGTLSHRERFPIDSEARPILRSRFLTTNDADAMAMSKEDVMSSVLPYGHWTGTSASNIHARSAPERPDNLFVVLKRLRLDDSAFMGPFPSETKEIEQESKLMAHMSSEQAFSEELVDAAWARYRKLACSVGGVDTNEWLEHATEGEISTARWSFLKLMYAGGLGDLRQLEAAPRGAAPTFAQMYYNKSLARLRKPSHVITRTSLSTSAMLRQYVQAKQAERIARWSALRLPDQSRTEFNVAMAASIACLHAFHVVPPLAVAVIADLYDETQFDAFCDMYPGILTQPMFQERLLRAARAKYPLISRDLVHIESQEQLLQGSLDKAYETIEEENPFPSMFGQSSKEPGEQEKAAMSHPAAGGFDTSLYDLARPADLIPENIEVEAKVSAEELERATREWTRERLALFLEAPLSTLHLAPVPIALSRTGTGAFVALPQTKDRSSNSEVPIVPRTEEEIVLFDERLRSILSACSARPVALELSQVEKICSDLGSLALEKSRGIPATFTFRASPFNSDVIVPIQSAMPINLPPFAYLLQRLPPSVLYWIVREYVALRVLAMENLHRRYRELVEELKTAAQRRKAAEEKARAEEEAKLRAKHGEREQMVANIRKNPILGPAYARTQAAVTAAAANAAYTRAAASRPPSGALSSRAITPRCTASTTAAGASTPRAGTRVTATSASSSGPSTGAAVRAGSIRPPSSSGATPRPTAYNATRPTVPPSIPRPLARAGSEISASTAARPSSARPSSACPSSARGVTSQPTSTRSTVRRPGSGDH